MRLFFIFKSCNSLKIINVVSSVYYRCSELFFDNHPCQAWKTWTVDMSVNFHTIFNAANSALSQINYDHKDQISNEDDFMLAAMSEKSPFFRKWSFQFITSNSFFPYQMFLKRMSALINQWLKLLDDSSLCKLSSVESFILNYVVMTLVTM